jgi:cobalamin biosynthesis protein CbiG
MVNSQEKILWVGVGCQRGVSKMAIGTAIESIFTQSNLDLATIAGLATIDLKANEVGLIDYCHEMGWFLKIYSPERLNLVSVNSSLSTLNCLEKVLHLGKAQDRTFRSQRSMLLGTASVAEAAALCAAGSDLLLVPKQKFRLDDESGWVTIAVAVELKQ